MSRYAGCSVLDQQDGSRHMPGSVSLLPRLVTGFCIAQPECLKKTDSTRKSDKSSAIARTSYCIVFVIIICRAYGILIIMLAIGWVNFMGSMLVSKGLNTGSSHKNNALASRAWVLELKIASMEMKCVEYHSIYVEKQNLSCLRMALTFKV
ncbi:uncharacterized protein K460DRAFT_173785 [Cucurbitaria berberidis CBS 394.84]|uniref:Uncharacterized protein n=1 Tax=Cucurbitaria berberidis CBS 394.84 TaxID=1168544 RepID=A0A9P4L4R9_9PLEO|nr:uncharacterized protein K460DRAFT_173785 [Cucurbitaria berberidis CBS 394.84]KAF1841805.1 hypothetical protein K460DRAFT_173785 [Cucurbitaria berberidis CBS 394.84]